MASMMGPSTLNTASGMSSPSAPRRPPQQMPMYGAPPAPGAGQTPTFGQMQQQGQARPAPPQGWYNYRPGSTMSQPNGAPPSPWGGNQQQPTLRQPPSGMGPQTYGAPPYPGSGGPYMGTGGQMPAMPPQSNGQYGGSGYAPPSMGWTPPQGPPQGLQYGGGAQQAPQGPGSQYGATPSATAQTQNTANQLGGATQNLLLNQLQNPSSYLGSPAAQNLLQQQLTNPNPLGSQAFQTQMQQAQTGINENMQQQADAINSTLAARGVYDSSLAGGYLKDLSTGAGRQMASIGANLLPQEAQLQLQGTNSALGNAMGFGQQNTSNINSALANSLGYGSNQFQQQYGTAALNLAQQQQQNQQLQQMLSLTQT